MGRSGAGTALRLFRLPNWRTNHIVLERHALRIVLLEADLGRFFRAENLQVILVSDLLRGSV